MRSVSSANNLRKVHAKKEAERAEMEGRTPTSARSIAPAGSLSGDEAESPSESPDAAAAQSNTQERHRELMSRMFPAGPDEAGRGDADRLSPSHQEASENDTTQTVTGDRSAEKPGPEQNDSNHLADVEMKEMSDAQAGEPSDQDAQVKTEDVRMPTVEEVSEEQEQEQARENK